MIYIIQHEWMSILFTRSRLTLTRALDGEPDAMCSPHVTLGELFGRVELLLELLFVGVHLPPGVTFETGYKSIDNFVSHRGETILCLVNTCRVYLLFRSIREALLSRLPKRQTIARMSRVEMDSSFALKLVLNSWNGYIYIAAWWLASLLFSAYWFRSLEMTACLLPSATHPLCLEPEATTWYINGEFVEKVNNAEFTSALWFNIVTSLSVGYGDVVPDTHVGKFIACIMAVVGIIASSLLAAALSEVLQFTGDEAGLIQLVVREQKREKLRVASAQVIQAWFWRVIVKRQCGPRRKKRLAMAKRVFAKTSFEVKMDVDECAGTESKIDTINQDTTYIVQSLGLFSDRLNKAMKKGFEVPRDWKEFRIDMDEAHHTKNSSGIERHLFQRRFNLQALMESKNTGKSITACVALAKAMRRLRHLKNFQEQRQKGGSQEMKESQEDDFLRRRIAPQDSFVAGLLETRVEDPPDAPEGGNAGGAAGRLARALEKVGV